MAIRDLYHDAETIARYVRGGQWDDKTLDDHLQRHARERGDKVAVVDRRWRLTYRELDRLAHRVACSLLHLGVGPGDVISIQTPNWAEWLIVHCAATKIGAVTNSIGAVYRHREVSYILDYAETALLRQAQEAYNLNPDDVIFMASPIGHTTALLVGARLPVMYGMIAVWQEHWNATEAVALIAREGCTFTLSATPFLYGLVHAPNTNRDTLKTFRIFACGGAPIPRQ